MNLADIAIYKSSQENRITRLEFKNNDKTFKPIFDTLSKKSDGCCETEDAEENTVYEFWGKLENKDEWRVHLIVEET